jgi:hypothetical protein
MFVMLKMQNEDFSLSPEKSSADSLFGKYSPKIGRVREKGNGQRKLEGIPGITSSCGHNLSLCRLQLQENPQQMKAITRQSLQENRSQEPHQREERKGIYLLTSLCLHLHCSKFAPQGVKVPAPHVESSALSAPHSSPGTVAGGRV